MLLSPDLLPQRDQVLCVQVKEAIGFDFPDNKIVDGNAVSVGPEPASPAQKIRQQPACVFFFPAFGGGPYNQRPDLIRQPSGHQK